MNKKQFVCMLWGLGLFAILGLVPLLSYAGRLVRPQTLSVSIPNLQTNVKERVVGFEIKIASGQIAALPNIPIGWNVSIDNDPSWSAKIEGSTRVGAAAVDPSFLQEFLLIEKEESPSEPFRLWGEVVVTEDFAAERHIPIGNKDIVLRETAVQHSAPCR